MAVAQSHGHFLAAEVGELAGVSGTTIGQWARWGYIRSSASGGEPRVYSVEDVGEAAIVAELLGRGVSHADVRRAIERLGEEYGDWPLSEAPLGTAAERGRSRVVLRERDGCYVLSPRGWQLMATPPPVEEVRLRLNRAAGAARLSQRRRARSGARRGRPRRRRSPRPRCRPRPRPGGRRGRAGLLGGHHGAGGLAAELDRRGARLRLDLAQPRLPAAVEGGELLVAARRREPPR